MTQLKADNRKGIVSKDDYLKSVKNNPFFCTLLNSVNNGILIADRHCIVRYVNSAYSRITGIEIREIIDRKLDAVRLGSRLPEVLETGKPLNGARRKSKKTEYIADICPIIVDEEIIGAISVIRDITEIEELSRRLNFCSYQFKQLKNKVTDIHKAVYNFYDIIGESKEMKRVKSFAERIADRDVAVLIRGESGTGKELFAHSIHNSSLRNNNPFVAINCAAFPPNLLLSELFGYEEGAFTGATKGGKLGLFELADNGTLFLDEIGDMDYELQSKLLRVLETGEFMRIGGTKPINVTVRIVSATNKNLEELIENKEFREDLFYRLNVISLEIPPLRNHRDDIPLLVDTFLERINKKLGSNYTMSEKALEFLCNYHFPGNVRELINILEFSANACEGTIIMHSHLPIIIRTNHRSDELDTVVKNSERTAIIKALNRHGQTVEGKRKAAAELGISLATLYNKIKQYNI